MQKSDNFSTYLNFDEKCSFGYFKSRITKCPIYTTLLPPAAVNIELHSQRTKEVEKSSPSEKPCTRIGQEQEYSPV